MSDPEEDPPGQSGPKVHVQIGRFRPVSDRYPQLFADKVDYEDRGGLDGPSGVVIGQAGFGISTLL